MGDLRPFKRFTRPTSRASETDCEERDPHFCISKPFISCVSLRASIGLCLYHSNQPAPRCVASSKVIPHGAFPARKPCRRERVYDISASLGFLHTADISDLNHPLRRFLTRLPPIPLPPLPNAPIHLPPRHTIPDQTHHHPQLLHILIPRFVIEEQHLFIPDPRLLVQSLEVRLLVPRKYLVVVEEFGGLLGR